MAWTGAPAGRAAPSRLAGGGEPGAGSGQRAADRAWLGAVPGMAARCPGTKAVAANGIYRGAGMRRGTRRALAAPTAAASEDRAGTLGLPPALTGQAAGTDPRARTRVARTRPARGAGRGAAAATAPRTLGANPGRSSP